MAKTQTCQGTTDDGARCDREAEADSVYCRDCSPRSVRHLYRGGLSAALRESMDALSSDPDLESLRNEVARMRLVLDRQFRKISAMDAIDDRLRKALDAAKDPTTERARDLIADYERLTGALQAQLSMTTSTMEVLRRIIDSHVGNTRGSKAGHVSVPELTKFLRAVIGEVAAVCGKEKARLVGHRIQQLAGDMEMSLPEAAG